MNLPNLLTMLRLLLMPFFVLAFYLPGTWSYGLSATIFALACATDWLDGFIARRYGLTSRLGAFLDPVADKLIVAIALVLLVERYASVLLAIPAAVIICREIVISALREWMAEVGSRAKVRVSLLGKIKTVAQMLAIIILLTQTPAVFSAWVWAGFILLYSAVALTLWSMICYLRAAWPEIRGQETER